MAITTLAGALAVLADNATRDISEQDLREVTTFLATFITESGSLDMSVGSVPDGTILNRSGAAIVGSTLAALGALLVAGGTMTGALTLAGVPVADLQAATKKYVDDNVGGKPAFDGEITLGQTMVAADFDCIERVYHMVFGIGDLALGPTPSIGFIFLNLPPGAFVSEGDGIWSKHEIIWSAPGLSDAVFSVATGGGGVTLHTNNKLELAPGDDSSKIAYPLTGQNETPEFINTGSPRLDSSLILTGANTEDLVSGELDVWIRMGILEDNPSVKFS